MHEHKEHTAQYARAAINDMVCMCIEYVRVCCLAMCERNSLGDDVVVAAANASTLPITHRRFVCACVYVVRRGGVPCVGVRVLRFLLLWLAQWAKGVLYAGNTRFKRMIDNNGVALAERLRICVRVCWHSGSSKRERSENLTE